MSQIPVPFLFMRGGTSRGPYFRKEDLPSDEGELSKILLSVVGSGNPRNIDGIGGGNSVTTKVAILSQSGNPDADIDYFFAQLGVEKEIVDFGPTCGNILVGVGPAAIELGLFPISGDETKLRIHAVNTGAIVESCVQTPSGSVNYEGDVAIDGVPGTAAPVALNFLNVVGSKCGSMLPTGNVVDECAGHKVTCIDVAMPMVIGRASDFGISGNESQTELDTNELLLKRIEKVRLEAGKLMGLGDVSNSVMPKFGLISSASKNGHFSARYFTPWNCHPAMAVTGSQCIAACALNQNSVIEDLVKPIGSSPATVIIEHPSGEMEVRVDYQNVDDKLDFRSAGVVRTARLIARGEVMVPARLITPQT